MSHWLSWPAFVIGRIMIQRQQGADGCFGYDRRDWSDTVSTRSTLTQDIRARTALRRASTAACLNAEVCWHDRHTHMVLVRWQQDNDERPPGALGSRTPARWQRRPRWGRRGGGSLSVRYGYRRSCCVDHIAGIAQRHGHRSQGIAALTIVTVLHRRVLCCTPVGPASARVTIKV